MYKRQKHNETGLLVREKDEFELAEALKYLIENPDFATELGRKGQDYVCEKFSWEHVSSLAEDVILQAHRKESQSFLSLAISLIS